MFSSPPASSAGASAAASSLAGSSAGASAAASSSLEGQSGTQVAGDGGAVDDDSSDVTDEEILARMLAALTPAQLETLDHVHAVVSDFPRAWAVQALLKNNFILKRNSV